MQNPREAGALVSPASDAQASTPKPCSAQLLRLPRRLLRKITVEPVAGGWRATIVGFDALFWSGAASRTFSSRHMAVEAAKAASRECGLPVVTVETLAPPDGPMAA